MTTQRQTEHSIENTGHCLPTECLDTFAFDPAWIPKTLPRYLTSLRQPANALFRLLPTMQIRQRLIHPQFVSLLFPFLMSSCTPHNLISTHASKLENTGWLPEVDICQLGRLGPFVHYITDGAPHSLISFISSTLGLPYCIGRPSTLKIEKSRKKKSTTNRLGQDFLSRLSLQHLISLSRFHFVSFYLLDLAPIPAIISRCFVLPNEQYMHFLFHQHA